MKRRRGQGLSLQVIVIAVLCLIVLVILIAVASGKISIFGEGASSCTAKGGTCESGSKDVLNGGCVGTVYVPGTDCEKDNKVCCMAI